jgi:hypothetical protein
MIEVIGKNGIIARVIADSVTTNGKRMTTFECEAPRIILAEINTMRMLSKNCSSSRAIPVNTILNQVRNDPFLPVEWGKNKAGMSSTETMTEAEAKETEAMWREAGNSAAFYSQKLLDLGLHKQWANRGTETYQFIKQVISGTEWNNLWWLRNHDAAQPEYHELSRVMHEAFELSVPKLLLVGEWHTPYVSSTRNSATGVMEYFDSTGALLNVVEAQKVSSSCCAQSSYRKSDDSLAKALDIYEKLVGMDRKHASPFEHIATPIPLQTKPFSPSTWVNGITHVNKNGQLGSGNLYGFIQFRQLIEDHTKWG